LIPVWTLDIEQAEVRRQEDVKSMDYMNPNVNRRKDLFSCPFLTSILLPIALTRRQIELILSEKELAAGLETGQATWISQGLKLEQEQYIV